MWKKVAVALGFTTASALAANKIPWPELPKTGFIKGRPATVNDAKRGIAVFSMNGSSKGALHISIPQYAIWTDGHGAKHPMIVVQAERTPNNIEMVGLRDIDGSEVAATMPEVTLLGTKKPH